MIGPVHTPPVPAVPADAAAALQVAVGDRGYTPADIVVAPGTTVRWRNDGFNRHTVTAGDGTFASRALGNGDRFTITAPATTGVHAYHCEFHAFMRGTLTVSDLTLTTDGRVLAGRGAHLTGVAPGAAAGTAVVVERRVAGAWLPYAAAVTDAAGGYSLTTPALAAGVALRARAGERTSPALRIAPVPAITVHRHAGRLTVRVNPHGAGARARLERLDLTAYRWHTVALLPVTRGGRIIAPLRAPGVYRVAVRGGAGLAAVTSRAVVHLPYRLRA